MKTVFKYVVEIDDLATVSAPVGAEFVHFERAADAGRLLAWALVDPSMPCTVHRFYIRGTGHPVEDGLYYRATVLTGPFVWHVFTEEPA